MFIKEETYKSSFNGINEDMIHRVFEAYSL